MGIVVGEYSTLLLVRSVNLTVREVRLGVDVVDHRWVSPARRLLGGVHQMLEML